LRFCYKLYKYETLKVKFDKIFELVIHKIYLLTYITFVAMESWINIFQPNFSIYQVNLLH